MDEGRDVLFDKLGRVWALSGYLWKETVLQTCPWLLRLLGQDVGGWGCTLVLLIGAKYGSQHNHCM